MSPEHVCDAMERWTICKLCWEWQKNACLDKEPPRRAAHHPMPSLPCPPICAENREIKFPSTAVGRCGIAPSPFATTPWSDAEALNVNMCANMRHRTTAPCVLDQESILKSRDRPAVKDWICIDPKIRRASLRRAMRVPDAFHIRKKESLS